MLFNWILVKKPVTRFSFLEGSLGTEEQRTPNTSRAQLGCWCFFCLSSLKLLLASFGQSSAVCWAHWDLWTVQMALNFSLSAPHWSSSSVTEKNNSFPSCHRHRRFVVIWDARKKSREEWKKSQKCLNEEKHCRAAYNSSFPSHSDCFFPRLIATLCVFL